MNFLKVHRIEYKIVSESTIESVTMLRLYIFITALVVLTTSAPVERAGKN